MRAALGNDNAVDHGAAARTGHAVAAKDLERVGVAAATSGDAVEVRLAAAERGAGVVDRALQDRAYRRVQATDFGGGEGVGAAFRMDARLP